MPTFLSVPPAILPANELAPEGQRMAAPAAGPARPIATPQVVERRLSNGLRVVAARSTDLPIMNAQLVLGGGAASDPDGKAGLASMTASLATQGAGGRSAPEIAATLERLGAGIGGGAGPDGTTLFVSAPVASAEAVGQVLADVVQRPDFAEAELERGRAQTINALTVNLRQPGPLAGAVLNRIAYGGAAYGRPSSGTPESVATLTREDVVAHHRQWWRPDNATVVITGGMTPEDAFTFAERTFGDWTANSGALPTLPNRAGQPLPPRVVVVDLPGAGQAAVTAAVRAPLRSDDDWHALEVANAVMGGGGTARLFMEIRAKRGLSYGASSSLGARVDGGLLTATTQTKNESAAEVVGLVLAEFDRLAREPVADAEVTNRETFLTGGYARSLETTSGLGGVLAQAVTNGLPLSTIETYPAQIAATTPASLAQAAGRVSADQAYVVVVGQAAMFIDALRAAHPDVVVIPATDLDLNSPTLGL